MNKNYKSYKRKTLWRIINGFPSLNNPVRAINIFNDLNNISDKSGIFINRKVLERFLKKKGYDMNYRINYGMSDDLSYFKK